MKSTTTTDRNTELAEALHTVHVVYTQYTKTVHYSLSEKEIILFFVHSFLYVVLSVLKLKLPIILKLCYISILDKFVIQKNLLIYFNCVLSPSLWRTLPVVRIFSKDCVRFADCRPENRSLSARLLVMQFD